MFGHGEKQSRKQDFLIMALLQKGSIPEAAREADIAPATAWRWMKDPSFQEKYQQARREAVGQAMAKLQTILGQAVDTLAEIMADSSASSSSRVQACRSVLEYNLRVQEVEDLEVRINNLERAALERAI